ncbi:hypothetical protein NM688_g1404 [Phlebia brevispora]|uniref:Uncharacterized protein n=1 Tax=Phlebia brevispora TaxID=194682 RepID=A0ACC1TBW4_9APHY|nr:hypothetical protein NM688_g1404 [Phlebia brevispora]
MFRGNIHLKELLTLIPSGRHRQFHHGGVNVKSIGVTLQDLNSLLDLDYSLINIINMSSAAEYAASPVSCSDGVIGGIGVGCVTISA